MCPRNKKSIGITTCWLLCNLGSLACVSIAYATDLLAQTEWSNQAIQQHVVLDHYSGELTGAQLNTLVAAGEHLFSARFSRDDGVGRPMATQAIIPTKRRRPSRDAFSRTAGMDANACASCHNVPLVGGAGDFTVNVFVSEGFQHTEFDTTDPQFSNERNTNHLFGAGLIELLAREMTSDLQRQRRRALLLARQSGQTQSIDLQTKGVLFGSLNAHSDGRIDTRNIDGVDADLVVRPFSHKGVMTSLRQFTINALNQHHGMQATERFGARWTATNDFDEDNQVDEISPGDVSALVAWQATLPPPGISNTLSDAWQAAAARGRQQFEQLQCSHCHRQTLPLRNLVFKDPGPLDAAGTLREGELGLNQGTSYSLELRAWAKDLPRNAHGDVLVPLFGDLKRHIIADNQVATLGNELLSQRFVERNVFMTSELWGVGSTAPYGHRGDLTSLPEVILAHGGEARTARDAYLALDTAGQSDIDAFLKSMVIAP